MSERKVPKLRFPEFNGDWESKTIYSITDRIGDGLHATPIYDDHGEYYFINGNNLVNQKVSIHNAKKVSRLEYARYPNYLTDESILMSINGTIGSLSYYKREPILLGKSVCFINILSKINKNFVFYYLSSEQIQRYFFSGLTGSTIKNLSLSTIRNTQLQFPCVVEQTKIADFLTSIDDKIQQLTKKKELLEQYKKGVMRDIFRQKIRFKDDNGSDYPNWQEKNLKEIAEINPKSESLPNKFYYIDLESVNNGRVGALDYINLNDAPSRAQRVLSDNDILFQMVRPYQRNNLLFGVKSEANYVASTGYAQLRARENYDFKFIFQLLLTDNFVNTVMLRCTGTSYPAINSSDLSTIIINIPKYEEQVKIADFLTNIDDKITQISAQLEQTKLFKKSLLQQLFI